MTEHRLVGQNVAGMQELEATLRLGEMQLASVRTSTHSIVDMLGAIWRGNVMDAFSMLWRNQHARSIEAAEESLRVAAETVRRNLEEQLRTSNTLYRGDGASMLSARATGNRSPFDASNGWSDGYMTGLIGYRVPVTDQARLNELMEDVTKGQLTGEDLDRAIVEMAEIRGQDPGDFRQQYDRYLELRQVALERSGKPVEQINERFHGDWLGSPGSLRYGTVVGDALGIDPVFGAMLNPTGGLVGPGNRALALGPNDALHYHGVVHDAAGYLYTRHDTGPGYDYLGLEPNADTANPLTGQLSGIDYWQDHHPDLDVGPLGPAGDAIWTTGEVVQSVVSTTVDGTVWTVNTAVDAGEWIIDTGIDAGNAAWDASVDAADWVVGGTMDLTTDVANEAVDFGRDTVDAFRGLGRWF